MKPVCGRRFAERDQTVVGDDIGMTAAIVNWKMQQNSSEMNLWKFIKVFTGVMSSYQNIAPIVGIQV